MHGVADHLDHAADGRLACAHACDELGAGLQLYDRAEALDRAGPQLHRGFVGDELASLRVVGVRAECRERHFDEIRIAIKFLAVGVGKLRALDHQMDEVRPDHVEAVQIEALEQRELLQRHRALAPRRLADGVAAVVIRQRHFEPRLPLRHVLPGQHALVRRAAGVHHRLGAAELVDRLSGTTKDLTLNEIAPYLKSLVASSKK